MRTSHGFALLTMIVIMLIFTSMIAFGYRVLSLTTGTHVAQLMAVQSDLATKAGIERASYLVRLDNICLSGTTVIDGYSVYVTCDPTPFIENGTTYTRYELGVVSEMVDSEIDDPDYSYNEMKATVIVP